LGLVDITIDSSIVGESMNKKSFFKWFSNKILCSKLRIGGFTLTEVLIATAIVGLIAVLVLPMVITNFQDKMFELAYNREKQSIENAIKALVVTENMDDYKKTILYTNEENLEDYSETSGKFIQKYLKVSKFCKDSNSDCFASQYYSFEKGTKKTYTPDIKGSCAILKNGMSICMTPQTPKESIHVLIDLNGKKGPNVSNRDLRSFDYSLATKLAMDTTVGDVNGDYTLIKFQDECDAEYGTYDPEVCCSKSYNLTYCCKDYFKTQCCNIEPYKSNYTICPNPCQRNTEYEYYGDEDLEACCPIAFQSACCSIEPYKSDTSLCSTTTPSVTPSKDGSIRVRAYCTGGTSSELIEGTTYYTTSCTFKIKFEYTYEKSRLDLHISYCGQQGTGPGTCSSGSNNWVDATITNSGEKELSVKYINTYSISNEATGAILPINISLMEVIDKKNPDYNTKHYMSDCIDYKYLNTINGYPNGTDYFLYFNYDTKTGEFSWND
jgi:prepilin-type N-terminal cleavage/methylation domain-containing protein